MAAGDEESFKTLLLTAEDIKKPDIEKAVAEKLMASIQEARKKASAPWSASPRC
ncbi:MAG: hypothetical protein U0872_11465 [Planctomycetaceae bacterium]